MSFQGFKLMLVAYKRMEMEKKIRTPYVYTNAGVSLPNLSLVLLNKYRVSDSSCLLNVGINWN